MFNSCVDYRLHLRPEFEYAKLLAVPELGSAMDPVDVAADEGIKLHAVKLSAAKKFLTVAPGVGQNSTKDTKGACALRWNMEQFHCQTKQLTGIEKCQCRNARIQRNHIACAILVWSRLTPLARSTGTRIYQLKKLLLSDYLRGELRSPSISMAFA